jgi:hypothetical protein
MSTRHAHAGCQECRRLREVADAAAKLLPSGDRDSLTEYAVAWADLEAAVREWQEADRG